MVVMPSTLKMQKHTKENNEMDSMEQQQIAQQANTQIEREDLERETLLVSQEIRMARELGCNDDVKRKRQLHKFRRWLSLRVNSTFPLRQDNCMRLWKGLYYCMWMADKPLAQEQLAEQIAALLEVFEGKLNLCVEFFGAFLLTMRNDWFGIDQWRMDKFLMLMRRMLRAMLRVLKAADWAEEAVDLFNKQAQQTMLAENGCAQGLVLHWMDIIFEELAKVAAGQITSAQVLRFLQPYIDYFVTQTDSTLLSHCRARIFHHLLYQSALGREYQEKYAVWEEMGFPTESIDDLEKVEAAADETEELAEEEEEQTAAQKELDPRAGDVDVYVPELPLDAAPIIERLQQALLQQDMSLKRRKMLKTVLTQFETYQSGKFPLGVKTMPRVEEVEEQFEELLEEKVDELELTEQELYGVGRKLKQLNKRKRRKLLKSINYDDVEPAQLDEVIERALEKPEQRKRQQVGMAEKTD